jgi:hypothetical protein
MEGNAFKIIASETIQEFACGDTKTCTQCGTEKPLKEFHIDKTGAMGRKAYCKSCKSRYDSNRKAGVSDDMIMVALERAAYKIIKERL